MGKRVSEATTDVMVSDRGAPEIPVELIDEAPENTRRSSWGNLDELAQSMRAQGQITPGCVRPSPTAGGRYELVVGARRLRAVGLAGLITFRAEVVPMDDRTAHRRRTVENLQREDISPMEEAEAFRVSRDEHGDSVEEIAASVGRSPGYVHQRLRLLDLVPEIQALIPARLAMSSGLLIAQLPAKVQKDCAQHLAHRWNGGKEDGFLTRDTVEDALAKVTRVIADAPSDTRDAELVPAAGSCSGCSKRTGTQGALFEEANRNDLCLDAGCWTGKTDAVWKRTTDDAKKRGLVVVSEKDAGAKTYDSRTTKFVSLDATALYGNDGMPKTWREIVGPDTEPTGIARDERTGEAFEVVPRDVASQALEAASKKGGKGKGSKGSSADVEHATSAADERYREEARRAKEKEAIERDGRRRAMTALVDAVTRNGSDEGTLRTFIVALMHGSWADVVNQVAQRRGLSLEDASTGKKLAAAEAITRHMVDLREAKDAHELSALAIELVASRSAQFTTDVDGFEALCEARGIDVAHHASEAKKAAAEKKRDKKAKAKGAKSKGSKKGTEAVADAAAE
jgi:ParB/RepB/Spo0J family partition protein